MIGLVLDDRLSRVRLAVDGRYPLAARYGRSRRCLQSVFEMVTPFVLQKWRA